MTGRAIARLGEIPKRGISPRTVRTKRFFGALGSGEAPEKG